MAYQIPLGGKMESPNINRSNVAEGFPGRAVLLGENCVFAKAQAYDDRIKRSIEVDQEAILKYRFDKVLSYYYILIARLNTDNRGNVVSDDVVIEYLRLSEKQWDDLTVSMNEMGTFTSLLLTKVKKTGDDGKDFSYVEVKLSNYKDIPQAVFAKVEQMVQTENFVQSIWGMVDAATTITVEMYEQKLREYYEELAKKSGQPANAMQVPTGTAPTPPAPAIQAPANPIQPPKRIIQGAAPRQVQPQQPQQVAQPQQVTRVQGAAVISPGVPAAPPTQFEELSAQEDVMSGMGDEFSSGDFSVPDGELE